MVGSDEGKARWESRIGAPTSKVPGTDVLTETLRTWFFLAAADLIAAPPYCTAPLAADVLLAAGVKLYPFG
jgi:hypothetical protein